MFRALLDFLLHLNPVNALGIGILLMVMVLCVHAVFAGDYDRLAKILVALGLGERPHCGKSRRCRRGAKKRRG